MSEESNVTPLRPEDDVNLELRQRIAAYSGDYGEGKTRAQEEADSAAMLGLVLVVGALMLLAAVVGALVMAWWS